ncbi:MAG: DUF4124 domain-containing protein [Pseudomonadales bacterium]|jgi:hypothetical protein|nr:DUF4124 domain-containing protein [Pseudomonadales bacterium]
MPLPSRFLSTALAGLLLVAAAGASGAAETIYRWVDASGTVHYGQVAPVGVAYEIVRPGNDPTDRPPTLSEPARGDAPAAGGSMAARSVSGSAASSADAGPRLTEAQQRMQEELEATEQARLAEIRAEKEENCRLAREQFEQFTTYRRIRMRGPDGEYVIIGEDERQQRIEEAKQAILLNCEDAG